MTELENDGQTEGSRPDETSGAGVAIALSALTLAACGGGGGSSAPPTQNPPPPPPVVPPPVTITDAEAARFLLQAQFAPTSRPSRPTAIPPGSPPATTRRLGRPASRGSTRVATTPSPPNSATSGRSSVIS